MRKLTKVPLPQETLDRLRDKTLHRLDRVALAEECRFVYGWGLDDMREITGVSIAHYAACQRILRSGNADVQKAYKEGKYSSHGALMVLKNPALLNYPRLGALVDSGAEVIFQFAKFALYRAADELCLASMNPRKQERVYVLTDIPCIVQEVIRVLGLVRLGEYHMSPGLAIRDNTGVTCGTLMHHMAARLYGVRLKDLCARKIRFNERVRSDGKYNFQINNVWFHGIDHMCGFRPLLIDRVGDWKEIELFRQELQQTTILSYTKTMWKLVNTYTIHPQSQDNREVMFVDKDHTYILYRLALADYLYCGLPADRDGLIDIMERFEEEYGEDLDVDHLDGNRCNCRVSNLMLMTHGQNVRKQAIQRKLKKLDSKYHVRIVRYENNTVSLWTGKYNDAGTIVYECFNEICDVETMLLVLKQFAERAK